MQKNTKLVIALLLGMPAFSHAQSLKSAEDSLSYAIGINIGENFRTQKIKINEALFMEAVKAAQVANYSVMDQQKSMTYIQSYFQNKMMIKAVENEKTGVTFLEKNKKDAGTVVTPSGLQYKVIKKSEGVKPTVNDKVKVHYHGTLIDGTVFDSSVERNEPATFGVTQVIKGWVEGLQLMSVGSKYTFYIPSALAYGSQAPANIGPNQVLIFDVELIEIVK